MIICPYKHLPKFQTVGANDYLPLKWKEMDSCANPNISGAVSRRYELLGELCCKLPLLSGGEGNDES